MTNRVLLAAIALGLWANALVAVVRPVRADDMGDLSAIRQELHQVYVMTASIAQGNCSNRKLCDLP